MRLPQSFYLKHMYSHTNYRASWLPDHSFRIGDVGKLEDGLFTIYTTLEQEGIRVSTRMGNSGLGFDYSAKKSFKVTSMADAGQKTVKGIIDIKFGAEGGVVFQMTTSKLQLIDNFKEIETAILTKYKNKEWRREWVVISELVIAENATILISTTANTSIGLECDVAAEFSNIKLADPSINLRVVSESSDIIKILASSQLAPLYQVKGIRQPFLGNPTLRAHEDLTLENNNLLELPFDDRELT